MLTKASQFLAVVLTALALLPGGAHLMALPAKIIMPEDPYFVVQQIYRGWALAGAVIFLAIFANILAALLTRHSRRKWQLFGAAGLLIAVTLAVFFVWTYPANQATGNWTSAPENWEQLRTDWEYSHAANAAITFVALLCSVGAAVSTGPRRESDARRASETTAPHRVTVHSATRMECIAPSARDTQSIAASERTAVYRRPMLE
jgi:MFS family permease